MFALLKAGSAVALSLLTFTAFPVWAAPTATSAPEQSSPVSQHKLFLKSISSTKLLSMLEWGNPPPPAGEPNNPILPAGVSAAIAVAGDNSLLVTSTADGFNLVKNIVENLDYPPRQLSFRVVFTTASKEEVEEAWLYGIGGSSTANQFYDALMRTQRKAVVSSVTSMSYVPASVTNEAPASLDVDAIYRTSSTIPGGIGTPTERFPLPTDRMINIVSRVNGDGTVSSYVTWPLYENLADPPATSSPVSQALVLTRTARSGETLAMAVPISMVTAAATQTGHGDMLIAFITPTIVDTNDDPKSPTAPVSPIVP